MNANSYAISQGMTSLRQLAEVTKITQKRLKELYISDPKAFDLMCEAAFHRLQVQQWIDTRRPIQQSA